VYGLGNDEKSSTAAELEYPAARLGCTEVVLHGAAIVSPRFTAVLQSPVVVLTGSTAEP